MKFTEEMRVTSGYCTPHRLLMPITAYKGRCPDPTRVKTARGVQADRIIREAVENELLYEWIELVSECGQATVVRYIERQEPAHMPEPLLEPEPTDKKKRRIQIEVEGK